MRCFFSTYPLHYLPKNKFLRFISKRLTKLQEFLQITSLLAAKPEVLETTTPNWGERIINGKPTTIEQHPYQAFLEISSSICSGSIISETVILTAAHCLEKATPQDVTAHVGITYANQIKYDAGYDSNKIAIHPSYDRATHDYDFGLIWVSIRRHST